MSEPAEQSFIDIISGHRRGAGASLTRAGLRLAEPLYSAAMSVRNELFARHIRKSHRAAVPVISVGNITTGGTGKTPLVLWLVQRLDGPGVVPAVLMRGYKARGGEPGDEQTMLTELLRTELKREVIVHANSDRVAGAAAIVRDHREVNVIILDDGFQHRRLARDFDVVVIDATNPFGFGHVIPRGLLREPLSGLARADAIVISRSDLVTSQAVFDIERAIRRYHPSASMFRARHVLEGFTSPSGGTTTPASLAGRRAFAFCGIGNPDSFYNMLQSAGETICGVETFSDHHAYTAVDVQNVIIAAEKCEAELLLTTEKDWAKLATLLDWKTVRLPVYRTGVRMDFDKPAGVELLRLVNSRLPSA